MLYTQPNMIKDTSWLEKAAAEAKEEANKEFQRQAVATQKDRDAETLKADCGRERTDIQAQIGRPMQQKDIEQRLRKLIPGVRFERSVANPAATGIYLGTSFLTSFSTGVSPEASLMEKTEKGHGRELIRGWRTMLSNLIRKGYIQQEAGFKAFDVLSGRQSERWYKAMN